MMVCFFPYIQESIVVNGTVARIATAVWPTTLFFPALIAMNIANHAWMTNTRMKMAIHITAWPAWIVIQQEVMNNSLL